MKFFNSKISRFTVGQGLSHTLCIATDEGLCGRNVLHSLRVHSYASMLNICSESMSTARMSLYSTPCLNLAWLAQATLSLCYQESTSWAVVTRLPKNYCPLEKLALYTGRLATCTAYLSLGGLRAGLILFTIQLNSRP